MSDTYSKGKGKATDDIDKIAEEDKATDVDKIAEEDKPPYFLFWIAYKDSPETGYTTNKDESKLCQYFGMAIINHKEFTTKKDLLDCKKGPLTDFGNPIRHLVIPHSTYVDPTGEGLGIDFMSLGCKKYVLTCDLYDD